MTNLCKLIMCRFHVAVVVFLALVFMAVAPARASAILSAGSDTVHVGDIFTIPISISGSAGVTSYQFDLSFNPVIIRALGFDDTTTAFATEATSEGGVLTGITGFIDNTSGLLSGIADSMSGVFGLGLTDGTLADLTFEALSPGTTVLHLSSAFVNFLDPINGDFILQDGSVTVLAANEVPEPATLLILAAALLAMLGAQLAACRRGRMEKN